MSIPLPVDERINVAGQLVVRARIFYDLWWYFEGEPTRPAIIETMRQYNEFFRFDPHAHFVSFVVHVAALFENRADTVNLPQLAAELGETGILQGDASAQAVALLTEVAPTAKKAIILRSNLFAHRSASLTYARAFELAEVTANQLRDLSDSSLRIVNRLLAARGLQEQIFHAVPRRHAERMMAALRKLE